MLDTITRTISAALVTDWPANLNKVKAIFEGSYQPFGKDNGMPGGTESEKHKFTGKPYSSSIGLYYYGARWYDPEIGRFISHDSRPGRMSRPQSLNPYTYVVNSPLNYVDPWGEAECNWNPFTWGGCAQNANTALNTGIASVANTVVTAYDSLSPEQKELLWIGVGIAATIATGGAAAPLVLGIGLAVGAGAVGVYAGYSLATGQQMTLHGALQAFSIGFAVGTVGASLAVKAGLIGGTRLAAEGQGLKLGSHLFDRGHLGDIAAKFTGDSRNTGQAVSLIEDTLAGGSFNPARSTKVIHAFERVYADGDGPYGLRVLWNSAKGEVFDAYPFKLTSSIRYLYDSVPWPL